MKVDKIKYYRATAPFDIQDIEDMLRYDRAFVSPEGGSVIAFPRFKVAGGGTYSNEPTLRRWESFGVFLYPTDPLDAPETISDAWFTYRRGSGLALDRVTFGTVRGWKDFN